MDFTHLNENGDAVMVDVTDKGETRRRAVAAGRISMSEACYRAVKEKAVPKGDALAVARVAGIMAAKRAWELIPMCHPIALTGADLAFELLDEPRGVRITATTRCKGETGVEMEALAAVSAAALTVYDMCKALQRDMTIDRVRLLRKSGGRSGEYVREE